MPGLAENLPSLEKQDRSSFDVRGLPRSARSTPSTPSRERVNGVAVIYGIRLGTATPRGFASFCPIFGARGASRLSKWNTECGARGVRTLGVDDGDDRGRETRKKGDSVEVA